MTQEPLKVADAKPHMVVVIWNGSTGEERYLHRDNQGWYVWGWPCLREGGKWYLEIEGDDFVNVTGI